jgi:hypothetical protein
MKVAKLCDGRLCELLRHDVPVLFDQNPGWSLVARPIGERAHRQAVWWVQSTQITWVLEITDEGE